MVLAELPRSPCTSADLPDENVKKRKTEEEEDEWDEEYVVDTSKCFRVVDESAQYVVINKKKSTGQVLFDPDEAFVVSMLADLKSLSSINRINARSRISQLIAYNKANLPLVGAGPSKLVFNGNKFESVKYEFQEPE